MTQTMKHNLKLLITAHFLITASCTAMENAAHITKPNILAELTCIKEPYTAFYLTENRVLINGSDQCSVVDPTTNKEIKRIFDNNEWSSCISVHPNKTKFAFSAHYPPDNKQKITIYDTKTCTVEHTINWDGATLESLLFSPLDDTIATVIFNSVNAKFYNYKTNKTTITDIEEAARRIKQTIPNRPASHSFCEHSPNGSFIARGTGSQIIITKPNQDTYTIDVPKIYNTSCFNKIAFHPNSKILITLSNPEGFLNYWDVSTFQHITTMTPTSARATWPVSSSLSFSPNGTKLLLVVHGKCTVLEVPFDVLYQPGAQQKALFVYWLLKNLNNDPDLPQDVRHLLVHTTLETLKR